MRQAVDWKFYDRHNEDHRAHRDPRPLESLEEVVSPGFDERGDILSNVLPPHFPRLSDPDRQIFESCALAGSKILWPHRNSPGPLRHLTTQYIMSRARCSAQEARDIADEAMILDATRKMINIFCDWARRRSARALIDYLYPFTLAMVEVEASDQEEPLWFYEPSIAGKKLPGIFGDAGICEDIEEDSNPDYLDFSWEPPERSEGVPSTIAYHVFEDLSNTEEDPWIERQPLRYEKLLNSIQDCKTLTELAQLGRRIHANNGFNRDQAGVFWTEYNSRKTALSPRYFSSTCRAMLDKIAKDSQPGAVGVYLHRVQQGEIKVSPQLSKYEWGVIWRKYKERKEADHERGKSSQDD